MPPESWPTLLADRGDLDGLRAQLDAGTENAADLLVDLLLKQGRSEEAQRLRRFGLKPDGSIASCVKGLLSEVFKMAVEQQT